MTLLNWKQRNIQIQIMYEYVACKNEYENEKNSECIINLTACKRPQR